jgi:iron(III) transport system ATP-binding protein
MAQASFPQSSELVFERVSHAYAGRFALTDISFTAPSAQVTAVLGKSGSGKSTLLRLAAGLEAPSAGAIWFGQDPLFGQGRSVPAEQRRIAMVFQDFALFPHLTLASNVAFGRPDLNRTAARALAAEWLGRVSLGNRLDAYPHHLSGGQQQRVALARALAATPRAVLLDEPFSGIDRDLRMELRDATLDALRGAGVTAIFVTHDAEDAMLKADQIVILAEGRLIQVGSPRLVYDHPTSLDAARALGIVNVAAGRITAGRLETPFGPLAAAHLQDEVAAIAAVRPEAITLGDGQTATVVDRRPAGAFDEIKLEAGGLLWRALLRPEDGPAPGTAVGVTLAARGAHVFEEAAPKAAGAPE